MISIFLVSSRICKKNMKNKFLSLLLLLSLMGSCSMFGSCKLNQVQKDTKPQNTNDWKKGLLQYRPYVNKSGNPKEANNDYYFYHEGKWYFIKWSECNGIKEDLSLFDNQFVRINAEFKNGEWDSDKPTGQSRLGDYVVFDAIEKLDLPVSISLSDGNANAYLVTRHTIAYDPVPVIESSSGYYSGGTPKNRHCDELFYFDVLTYALDLLGNLSIHTNARVKDTGLLTIKYAHKEESCIIVPSDSLSDFKKKLDSILQ
jgi:hypothetical protein